LQEVIMQLFVRGHGVQLSDALRDHCTERIERALSPFVHQVRTAEIVLVDFNGPRGGMGHAARLAVLLSDGTRLLVQGIDSDFYAAGSQVAARVGQLVRRELSRTRDRARKGATSMTRSL
jgi:ribosome-associated translation inhibitor RaiA